MSRGMFPSVRRFEMLVAAARKSILTWLEQRIVRKTEKNQRISSSPRNETLNGRLCHRDVLGLRKANGCHYTWIRSRVRILNFPSTCRIQCVRHGTDRFWSLFNSKSQCWSAYDWKTLVLENLRVYYNSMSVVLRRRMCRSEGYW
jgi:hypothetical protein